jgi:hypothetical protein
MTEANAADGQAGDQAEDDPLATGTRDGAKSADVALGLRACSRNPRIVIG